jgi:hypothetical protein
MTQSSGNLATRTCPDSLPGTSGDQAAVFPYLVFMEFLAALLISIGLMVWALAVNAPLLPEANPGKTENPAKAPWYFVGLQELLVYFDPWIAGVLLPGLIIVGLIAIPYIDTNPKGIGTYAWKERPFANALFMLGVVMWFVLIFIGAECRGPNYAWYWPWESWFSLKAAPAATWSVFGPKGVGALPMLLGIPVLGALFAGSMLLPKLIQKELSGKKLMAGCLAAVGVLAGIGMAMGKMGPVSGAFMLFFGGMSFYFGFVLPQRHIRALDWPRYLVTMALVVCTMGVLLKMCARLTFNIKYVLTIPTISLNI